MIQEGYKDLKYIYTDIMKELKTPEVTGGILILLILYKYFYYDNFINIMNMILEKFSFIIIIFQTFFDLSIILSIISVLITMFNIIVLFCCAIASVIYDEYKKRLTIIKHEKRLEVIEKILESIIKKARGYYSGSMMRCVNSSMWIIIFGGYLYIADKLKIDKYINVFINIKGESLEFFKWMYFMIISLSLLSLIIEILRKFFYLKNK